MVIQNILVTRDGGYLNVMALHNIEIFLALTSYSDYFINVFNRLLCTMFWDNVWCIIPFLLNWVWDASLVGKHGKCELLCIIRTTRYKCTLFSLPSCIRTSIV